MGRYVLKSLMQIVPVMFIITIIVFVLVHVAGDPVNLMLPETASEEDRAALRTALGLDKPLYVQYMTFLGNVLHGEFGTSFHYGQEALPLVLERLPATFQLAAASIVIAVLIAVPCGILSAAKRNSVVDVLFSLLAVIGKAMPNFWIGIMLILFFSVELQWFPVSGRGGIEHLVLPAFTVGVGLAAQMTRLIRSGMLEILSEDYIRTARSKGLRESVVVCVHAFRNGLIPVVTVISLQFTSLIGGTLVTETVFAWPGLGMLLVTAVNMRDMAVVQAAVFIIAFTVIACNLLTDLVYRWLDPRIKYQ